MNIANLTNEELIEIAKQIPEFQEKIEAKLKEKQNAEMLQEEQNLADELRAKEKEYDKTEDDISFLEEKLNNVRNRKDNILSDIVVIKTKLEDIHKKWIELNPAQLTVEQPKKINHNVVREAFDLIWDMQCVNGQANGIDYALALKRFDNLVHARCKTANLFNSSWNVWEACDFLRGIDNEGCRLAGVIADLYNKCALAKKDFETLKCR